MTTSHLDPEVAIAADPESQEKLHHPHPHHVPYLPIPPAFAGATLVHSHRRARIALALLPLPQGSSHLLLQCHLSLPLSFRQQTRNQSCTSRLLRIRDQSLDRPGSISPPSAHLCHPRRSALCSYQAPLPYTDTVQAASPSSPCNIPRQAELWPKLKVRSISHDDLLLPPSFCFDAFTTVTSNTPPTTEIKNSCNIMPCCFQTQLSTPSTLFVPPIIPPISRAFDFQLSHPVFSKKQAPSASALPHCYS